MTFGRYTLAPGPEWTSLAATWPVRYVFRMTEGGHWLTDVVHVDLAGQSVGQAHLACWACGQSVACLHPGTTEGDGYLTTTSQILAGILAHIRQAHPDVQPEFQPE